MYHRFSIHFKTFGISNNTQLSIDQNSCDIHLVSAIISFSVIIGGFSAYRYLTLPCDIWLIHVFFLTLPVFADIRMSIACILKFNFTPQIHFFSLRFINTWHRQNGAHHIARGVCQGYRKGGEAATATGGLPAHAADVRLELRSVPVGCALADTDHWCQAPSSNAVVLGAPTGLPNKRMGN